MCIQLSQTLRTREIGAWWTGKSDASLANKPQERKAPKDQVHGILSPCEESQLMHLCTANLVFLNYEKKRKSTQRGKRTRLLVERAASRGTGGPSRGAGGLLVEPGLGLRALLLVLVHLLQFLLCLEHPQPHLRQMHLCAQPYKSQNK